MKTLITLIVLYVLLLWAFACATVPTARGIALDFRDCFEGFPASHPQIGSGTVLSIRCECLKDADRRCVQAGFGAGCWRDGFNDEDHDGWAVWACDERERRGL